MKQQAKKGTKRQKIIIHSGILTTAFFTCHSEEGVHLPAGTQEFQSVKRPKQEYVPPLI
jgi:hypothetical protein